MAVSCRPAATRQLVIRTRWVRWRPSRPGTFRSIRVVRKAAAALATSCSILVKAAEETPAAPAALIRRCTDAGVPAGVNEPGVWQPARSRLIPSPVIRKVTFTGSHAGGQNISRPGRPAHESRSPWSWAGMRQ